MDHTEQVIERSDAAKLAADPCNGRKLLHAAPQARVGLLFKVKPVDGSRQRCTGRAQELNILLMEEIGLPASEHQLTQPATRAISGTMIADSALTAAKSDR